MIEGELQVRQTVSGVEVRLHVLPRARRCEISGIHDGALKVRVTAPPVDDAANRAIIQFLSNLLGISKSSISIQAGSKSRNKVLQISGLTPERFLELIHAGSR